MMKDLQLTKEEAKEQMEPSADNAPKYPWGLCLNLDSETMKKLGISDALPAVGTTMKIMAVGKVTSLSQHEEQDGDKGSCMSIQLVAMDMEKAEESMSEKADKIWPTS